MDGSSADTVKLEGDFRIRSIEAVRKSLLEQTGANLKLDLGAVTEFDSAGVQVLLALKKELTAGGKTLRCSAMSEPVERLLSFYGLINDLFQKSSPAVEVSASAFEAGNANDAGNGGGSNV